MSACLSVCLSFILSCCLSTRPWKNQSVFLSLLATVFLQSLCHTVRHFAVHFVCLSVCMSVFPSMSISPSACLFQNIVKLDYYELLGLFKVLVRGLEFFSVLVRGLYILQLQSNLYTTATLGNWKMWSLCRGLSEKDQC